MNSSLLPFILLSFSSVAQDAVPPANYFSPNPPKTFPEIYTFCGCGDEAHYAGGIRALQSYVQKKLIFPSDIVWGDVTKFLADVYFIVEMDGSITELSVGRTNYPPANDAVLDALKDMPNWIPNELDCTPVRTRVRLPITVSVK